MIPDISFFRNLLFYIFLSSFVIQLFYYLFFYSRLAFIKQKPKRSKKTPVSIIICAKDEAPNLKENLPSILDQDFDDFEVIVVNDCSQDETAAVLENFEARYKHLKVTTIKKDPKFSHGKKLALTIGIKAAKNEWLLLTDADCKPESKKWLTLMQRNFTTATSVVLGYGGYLKKPSLLNNLIRFDTFFIALQYFGFALRGIPYMGVGRNLAYRKSLFFKTKGFSSHLDLLSGDDDLFIGAVANANNTRVEFDPLAQTRAVPETTFGNWVRQKRRHFTTGWHYRRSVKWLLGTEIMSRILFYTTFFCFIFSQNLLYPVLILFLFRWIIMGIIFNKAMNRLKEKNLFISSFIYDLFIPLFAFVLTILNLTSPTKTAWK